MSNVTTIVLKWEKKGRKVSVRVMQCEKDLTQRYWP